MELEEHKSGLSVKQDHGLHLKEGIILYGRIREHVGDKVSPAVYLIQIGQSEYYYIKIMINDVRVQMVKKNNIFIGHVFT